MDPVTLTLGLGLSATFIGGAAYLAWRERRKREALWRKIADERGGAYIPAKHHWLRPTTAAIEAVVGHTVCYLDTYAVGAGNNRQVFTRCRAGYSLGRGPTFKVVAEGILSKVGKVFGAQDVELGGDAEFDEKFIVKTEDAEATREAWTRVAKRLLRTKLARAEVTSNEMEVKVTVPRLLRTESDLDRLLDLTAELASFGARTLDAYVELPGARFEPAAGEYEDATPPRLSIDGDRASVRVLVRTRKGRPGLRLTLATDVSPEPFQIDLGSGASEGRARGLLNERATARLGSLGDAIVMGDGELLQVQWAVAPAPEAVAQGVKLLGEIAQAPPTQGAFR